MANPSKPTSIGPEVIIDAVLRQVHAFLTLLPNLLMCAVFLLCVWLIARLMGRGVQSAGRKSHLSTPLVRALSRLSAIVVWVLGLFTAATIVIPSFNPGSMIAGLGISSIAIGFAFKDIFQNFLAGLLLLWSQPFKVGDQIKSGSYEGFVEDIDIRATLIKTYDGERAIMPNSEVYTNAILVKSAFESKRGKVEISVDKTRPVDDVRALVEKIVRRTDGVLENPAPAVSIDLKDSAMHFTVYLWSTNPGAAQDRVLMNLIRAFNESWMDVGSDLLVQK